MPQPVGTKIKRRIFPALVVTCLLALLIFRKSALSVLGESLVVSDPLNKADLIYVLAGDFFGNRVLLGADLGARGYAPRVLLSGGPYSTTYSGDLALQFAVEHGYPPKLFSAIRISAQSTIDEARALRPVFRSMGARRIILVTSNFHSRRTALVFRLFLPDLQFWIVPAPDADFDPRSWWKVRHSRALFFSEYRKIFGTLLVKTGLLTSGNPASN
jgi:uncharacterized SAM-binding protein YcdF (DUF218 family)